MESAAEAPAGTHLSPEEVEALDAYWRAANYLSVGQIYLLDNPLLREPLTPEHVKLRLLGHFGTTPGLNLIYAHMNRAIAQRDLSAIYIAGPGHGGPGLVANAYLEGTYSRGLPAGEPGRAGHEAAVPAVLVPGRHPEPRRARDAGLDPRGRRARLLARACVRRRVRQPRPLVACVVGDGEAETGPLAASWHSNKFLSAKTDGAVLPILHLNGYKIANPTVLARIPEDELLALFRGYGYEPVIVDGGAGGEAPKLVHERFAAALDGCLDEIARIQDAARNGGATGRPRWPMLILRTPKGWTGPKEVDGKPTEGTWRSHQVPLADVHDNPEHLRQLEQWLRELPARRALRRERRARAVARRAAAEGRAPHEREPGRERRRAAARPRPARLPRLRGRRARARHDDERGDARAGRDAARRDPREPRRRSGSSAPTRPRRTGSRPCSRRADRAWEAELLPTDEHLAPEGRVLEVLSEHLCQGWLEGYLLTGRHGLFNCYEAFIHIIDAMFNQHAKWLKTTRDIPWRRPIASLQLPAQLARLAAGPQRLLAPGPGLHRPRREQEGRGRSASTCRPTPTACSRSPTTACAAATT